MAGEIDYSERLIQSLEGKLGLAFNQKYLRLTRRPQLYAPAFSVDLMDEGKYAQADDGLDHRVLEVLSADDHATSFYFGFTAQFELSDVRRKQVLRHASLIVFHDICAGEMTSLFRAEWDEKAASDATSEHAQPHWHFVQSPSRIENIIRSLLTDTDNDFVPWEKSELFSAQPDFGRFHFAMTSLWENGRTPQSYKQTFDSDGFKQWFAVLTKYVASRIAYILRHAPEPRDFVPSGR